MSKIIGITVGTQLPKPNFNQTDPTKGDYIKNKPDFDGLQSTVDNIGALVGDKSVSEQINTAIDNITPSDIGAVATEGDAAINGDVSAYSFDINAEGQHPNIAFNDTVDGEMNPCGIILFTPKHRVSLEARTQDHAYVEAYQLPTPADTATSNVYYDILTSKTPVKIEQGGTGATTAEQARANLGITDEKVRVEVRDGTTSNAALFPVGVTSGNEVTGSVIRYNGISYNIINGDETTLGRAQLLLGNNIAEGTAGNKQGRLSMYSADGATSGSLVQENGGSAYVTSSLPKAGGVLLSVNNYKSYVTPDNIGAAKSDHVHTIDDSLSETSDNPVKNKAVSSAINALNTLVGDTAVADQISAAIDVLRAEIDESKITIEDVDEICGGEIQSASEVMF